MRGISENNSRSPGAARDLEHDGCNDGQKAVKVSDAVERAFELARAGQCRSVAEIIRRLPEGDRPAVEAHLRTPSARRALILICSDAWLAAR